jgi:predicted cation transporter
MIGLIFIFITVLIMPFISHKIEKQIEAFLFLMGLLAVTVMKKWSISLFEEALVEPIQISLAVLAFGVLFKYSQKIIDKNVTKLKNSMGLGVFVFLLVLTLGLISSIVTAIMASLILVEIISYLRLDRRSELKIVVLSCFSIGLGAVLTPIGEPLSTIVISKLKYEPFHADFLFIFRHLWFFILPALILLGGLASVFVRNAVGNKPGLKEKSHETIPDILLRAAKVYIFIFGLILLGASFKPLIDAYISKIPTLALFWINSLSAVLDNATLAAAEIGPSMSLFQIKSAILALAVAGEMLIPGNIPNIIAANKLKIGSREWAAIGVPIGLALMILFCVDIFL